MGLLLLSSFSKYNAWSYRYYNWVGRFYHQSVNRIWGRIMVGFIVVVVHQSTCGGIMVWFVIVDSQ